jgi:orotidine-5'-phosphate decarboxylase
MPPVQPRDRLIVALDHSSRNEIMAMADQLDGAAGLFKIGLQAFVANGPSIAREFAAAERRLFLDLKLHDIPNTVERAAAEAARLGISMLTIHASGGRRMIEAAARAKGGADLRILAVTVLTSLGAGDLDEIGFASTPAEAVRRLALLARDSGADGVVASPREIETIREACGAGFLIVTPGIRAAGDATGDQARTLSAPEALARGADYIVVGRPITGAADPRRAALQLLA